MIYILSPIYVPQDHSLHYVCDIRVGALYVQVRKTGRYVVQVAIYEAWNMPQV